MNQSEKVIGTETLYYYGVFKTKHGWGILNLTLLLDSLNTLKRQKLQSIGM